MTARALLPHAAHIAIELVDIPIAGERHPTGAARLRADTSTNYYNSSWAALCAVCLVVIYGAFIPRWM